MAALWVRDPNPSAYTAQLKAVHVREGDLVDAGQILAEPNASEAEASRDGAASRVEQLRASQRRAVASETLARPQLQRAHQLAKYKCSCYVLIKCRSFQRLGICIANAM